jgi:hypothetical protein
MKRAKDAKNKTNEPTNKPEYAPTRANQLGLAERCAVYYGNPGS